MSNNIEYVILNNGNTILFATQNEPTLLSVLNNNNFWNKKIQAWKYFDNTDQPQKFDYKNVAQTEIDTLIINN